jgi:hypothetical protein
MKKFLLGICICLFLSGCNKKVSCTGIINDNDMTSSVTATANFKNDKLKKQTIKMTHDFSKYLTADLTIDKLYDSFVDSYSKYNDKDGLNIEIIKDTKNISLTIEMNLGKISDEIYGELGMTSSSKEKVSVDDYITSFQKQNFKCK